MVILYIGLFCRPSYSLLESAMPKPPLELQTTTLWEYPSQHYGDGNQGDKNYLGATPSWIIWNLLQRYTKPKDLVVDPMAGSGTTLDVARDISRRALGYDLQPTRKDIFRSDARKLPLEDGKADFVFIDPPYSTHVKYSGLPECIGELSADGPDYYQAMDTVIGEINRILRPDRFMALYVSDSFEKDKAFHAIGFELFRRMQKYFDPVDIICVVRHNAKLKKNNWHTAAVEGNFFLRGFNYLFIMHKPLQSKAAPKKWLPDRRPKQEIQDHVETRKPKRNGFKPAWERKRDGDKPARQGKRDGDKPAWDKKKDGDKPAWQGKRDGDKPAWDKKKDGDKPARQGKKQGENKKDGRSKSWNTRGRQRSYKDEDQPESPRSSGRGKPYRQGRQGRHSGSDQWEQPEKSRSGGGFQKPGKKDGPERPGPNRSQGKPAAKGSGPGRPKAKPGRKPNAPRKKNRP
ncbi:DNA methylase [Desulfatibacillum alkenivorans DSM 16219]|uniref:DNA methylase n=2 Tax=Desulfatibacillum alkenivorans TaxID=259354 RepID=A0A1M6M6V1_9BACT|nr:DNA methylase [Desulfatibacillum alkenivorans DSM 16219]